MLQSIVAFPKVGRSFRQFPLSKTHSLFLGYYISLKAFAKQPAVLLNQNTTLPYANTAKSMPYFCIEIFNKFIHNNPHACFHFRISERSFVVHEPEINC